MQLHQLWVCSLKFLKSIWDQRINIGSNWVSTEVFAHKDIIWFRSTIKEKSGHQKAILYSYWNKKETQATLRKPTPILLSYHLLSYIKMTQPPPPRNV